MIEVEEELAALRWEEVSTFLPDLCRSRFYDDILDLGCWRIEMDLRSIHPSMERFSPCPDATPIIVAGKAAGPDQDALVLAEAVLNDLPNLLSKLLSLGESFVVGWGEWMLRSIWFPYQTFGARWYASFETEYDGEESFGFTSSVGNLSDTTFERVSSNLGSLVAAPGNIRYCVDQLHQAAVPDLEFRAILDRIRNEPLFGPELAPQLNEVLERSEPHLPPWLFEHLQKMLNRVRQSGPDGRPVIGPQQR